MSLDPTPTAPLLEILEAAERRCAEGCPHTQCLAGRLRPVVNRFVAATPGPWRWMGYASMRELHLATTHSGHYHVLDFVRWGTHSAQPRFHMLNGPMVSAAELFKLDGRGKAIQGISHPDATFLESSWEDVALLLQLLQELLQS